MNETSLRNPHIVSARFVRTISRDGTIRTVLKVQTELRLNAEDEAYRAAEMDRLTNELASYMVIADIDSVEVSRGSFDAAIS